MPITMNQTLYGGITVDQATRKSLEDQPAGEFLNFVDAGNGQFKIRPKFPETGVYKSSNGENKIVPIRKYLNYMMKGIANMIMVDGKLDLSAADYWTSQMGMSITSDVNLMKQILDKSGMKEEDKAGFIDFMLTNGSAFTPYIMGFGDETEMLNKYFRSMNELRDIKDPLERAAKERVLLGAYDEVMRIIDGYNKLTQMDPEKEKEIFFTPDCGGSATANARIGALVDEYRKLKDPKLHPVGGEMYQINFQKRQPGPDASGNLPQGTLENAFDVHALYTIPVQIGGESKVLSLETTAPPIGNLFFHPKEARTATGIYDSKDAIKAFHEARNTIVVKDRKAVSSIKKTITYKGDPNVMLIFEIPPYMKMLLAARAQSAKTGPDELISKAGTAEIDSKWKSSSKEFKAMKESLTGLQGLSGDERTVALAALRKAAKEYTAYKMGAGASSHPSDYEKARVAFGIEVLEYASAELNTMAGGDIERNPVTLANGGKAFLADGGGGLIPAENVKAGYMKEMMRMLTGLNSIGMMPAELVEFSKSLGQSAAELEMLEPNDINLDKISEITEKLEKAADGFVKTITPGSLTPEQKTAIGICVQVKQLNQMATYGVKEPDKQYRALIAGKVLGNIVADSLADNKPHMADYCKRIMNESDTFEAVLYKTGKDAAVKKMAEKTTPQEADKLLDLPDAQFMKGYGKLQPRAKAPDAILEVPTAPAAGGAVIH